LRNTLGRSFVRQSRRIRSWTRSMRQTRNGLIRYWTSLGSRLPIQRQIRLCFRTWITTLSDASMRRCLSSTHRWH
jgi:hypothetical protein